MLKFTTFVAILLLAPLFLFSACGKRGNPSPPSFVIPAKILDLRVEVAPGKRTLAWSMPTLNSDKSRPVDLQSFRVLLKKLPVGQDSCKFCDEGFDDFLTLNLAKPSQGYILGTSFYLSLPDVPPGYLYVFAVLSQNSRGWDSDVSNKVAVTFLPSVLAPLDLICNPTASVVDLQWRPPVVPLEFKDIMRYRVYRRAKSGDSNSAWQLITPEPVFDPEFIDVGLNDWSSYEYAVTAFLSVEDSLLESNLSIPALVVPGDYSPPAKLENFSAFYFQGYVQLIWSPGTEADLAGYRVYRRDDVTGIDRQIAELSSATHEFADRQVFSGRTYHYRVTAFDLSDRNNESIPTDEVAVAID